MSVGTTHETWRPASAKSPVRACEAVSLNVLLIIRARAEQYPSFVYQANLLSGSGLQVGVLQLAPSLAAASPLAPAVHQWVAHRPWDSKKDARPHYGRRLLNGLHFAWACRSIIRQARPEVVLGHEPLACAHLPPGQARHRTVYHFHELPETYPGMGFLSRRAYLRTIKNSQGVDLVVFSDEERARRFQSEAHLPVCPTVVMNCPMRIEEESRKPKDESRNFLCSTIASSSQGLRFAPGVRVVCYLGSVGSNQGLPGAALSMRYWPADSVFLLIGSYADSMRRRILENAQAAGAAARVLFLGARPHREALALAAGADLGLSLIQPNSPNLLYSAGAVNKRFEYMALGVPQVTNKGPGVAEIVERNQCGLCADPNRPEEVGAAVKGLLGNPALLRQMAANGRRAHLDRYNYEVQFQPILDQVARWCA